MTVQRERFSSRADPELLTALRELARREERPISAVLEDAMRDYIAERNHGPGELLTSHRRPTLDEWWPPHPTARWVGDLSLRREDLYEERM